MNNFLQEALDFFKDLVIIIAIVLFVRTFLIMPFQINGQSMSESYYDKEFIIVDRFSYLNLPFIGEVSPIQRGDVVVFKPWVSQDRKYFIKRVIGLPWDRIKIEDGNVFLQTPEMDEYIELEEIEYLSEENEWHTNVGGSTAKHEYEIPPGRYFVMGDNRRHSTDSRTCFHNCNIRTNYITESEIIGKVFLDLWYFNFKKFAFTQPELGISSYPRFFSSPWTYEYLYE